MNEVKQLPRGIPDGYKAQRMTAPTTATVLVSEWARKAAHELDDMHRHWIMARQQDKFSHIVASPFEEPVDHVDWLANWHKGEERHLRVTERRLWIEHKLSDLRSTRKIAGKRQHKHEYDNHIDALKLELLYVRTLQERMRFESNQVDRAVNKVHSGFKLKEIAAAVRADENASPALKALIELQEALVVWVNESKMSDDVPESLNSAIERARMVMRAYATDMQQEVA